MWRTTSSNVNRCLLSICASWLPLWHQCLTNSTNFRCKVSKNLKTKFSRSSETSKRTFKTIWRLNSPNSTIDCNQNINNCNNHQIWLNSVAHKSSLRLWSILKQSSLSLIPSTKSTSMTTRRCPSCNVCLIRMQTRLFVTSQTWLSAICASTIISRVVLDPNTLNAYILSNGTRSAFRCTALRLKPLKRSQCRWHTMSPSTLVQLQPNPVQSTWLVDMWSIWASTWRIATDTMIFLESLIQYLTWTTPTQIILFALSKTSSTLLEHSWEIKYTATAKSTTRKRTNGSLLLICVFHVRELPSVSLRTITSSHSEVGLTKSALSIQ